MYLKLQFGGSPTYLCTIKPEMSNTTIYKDIKTKNKKKKTPMFAVFYDCCACDAWLTREIIGEGGCDFAATV